MDAPTDYVGRACGADLEVKNKPYLLFINLRNSFTGDAAEKSPSVCVDKCPDENFMYNNKTTDPIDKLRKKLYCTTDVNITSITTQEQLNLLTYHNKCTTWYLASEPIFGACYPNSVWPGHEKETISNDLLQQIKRALEAQQYYTSRILSNARAAM